jgi:hypothetical protein
VPKEEVRRHLLPTEEVRLHFQQRERLWEEHLREHL